MSDIEKRIEQWRSDLASSETLGATDIRELESHLREEMEHLRALRLSEDEAFLLARHRLGDPAALAGEFQKVNGQGRLLHTLCWGIMAVLLYFTAATCANAASVISLGLGYLAGLPQIALSLLAGATVVGAFTGTVGLALWWYVRHVHQRVEWQSRRAHMLPALAAMALALGALLFSGIRIVMVQIICHSAGVANYARMSYGGAWADFALRIVTPVLLAGLFLVLYLGNRREARAT